MCTYSTKEELLFGNKKRRYVFLHIFIFFCPWPLGSFAGDAGSFYLTKAKVSSKNSHRSIHAQTVSNVANSEHVCRCQCPQKANPRVLKIRDLSG